MLNFLSLIKNNCAEAARRLPPARLCAGIRWDGGAPFCSWGRVEVPSSVFGWSLVEMYFCLLPFLFHPSPFLFYRPQDLYPLTVLLKSQTAHPSGLFFPIGQYLELLSEISGDHIRMHIWAPFFPPGCRGCLTFTGGRRLGNVGFWMETLCTCQLTVSWPSCVLVTGISIKAHV